jgi:hypothetical protein
MNIKHRLYTRNYAEVAIPNSLNDSTLVKFLQSIAGVKPESWTSRWQDRIEVNGNLLECIVLENFVDFVISKEAKDFLTECAKIKVDEFVFTNPTMFLRTASK